MLRFCQRVDTFSFLPGSWSVSASASATFVRFASIFFRCRAAAFHRSGRLASVAWRQRLAGVKLAVDRVLVRVPRLRVAPERLLGAQVAHGRRGGELLGREVLGHRFTPHVLEGPQKRETFATGLFFGEGLSPTTRYMR